MKKISTRIALLAITPILFVLFIFCSSSYAAPVWGDISEFKQPDGSTVRVKLWGDEFYMRGESIDGYTLIKDPVTGWICYAELNKDKSDFISTGIIYKDNNSVSTAVRSDLTQKRPNIVKGLTLSKKHIEDKAKERKKLLLQEDPAEKAQTNSVRSITTNSFAPASQRSIKGLTILVDFPDVKSALPKSEIENMLNMQGYTGYGNKGSIRDYFFDVSSGAVDYTNIATDFYTLKNNKSYYDNPDVQRNKELVKEALDGLKAKGFDFSTLATDDQGYVLGLNVMYAGVPDCGWAKGLWPYQGSIPVVEYDIGNGKKIKFKKFQITNIGTSLAIGTFCHESGHLLFNWPDLYDYDADSEGTGWYCLMGGSNQTNPIPPNPYLRAIEGWQGPTILNNLPDNTTVTLTAKDYSSYVYTRPNSGEVFIIENVMRIGRWISGPGYGLLIWHIDPNGSNNFQDMTPEKHYMVSVVQADGLFDLEKKKNGGDANDYFFNGNKTIFNDTTLPNSKWWDGTPSGLSISNVGSIGSPMTFIIHNSSPQFTPTPTPTPTSGSTYTSTPTPTSTPTLPLAIKVAGYVKPAFDTTTTSSELKVGFKAENTFMSALTDNNGYFEKYVAYQPSGFSLKVSKNAYLSRTISNIPGLYNITIGSQSEPVEIWAGDVNGDSAINMVDIMEIAKAYNTTTTSANYNADYDYNKDGAVNMADIMIAVQKFNKTAADYPVVTFTTNTPTSTPTHPVYTNTPTTPVINTPTPTSNGIYPSWDSNSHTYAVGDKVSYQGNNYECIYAHTSNVAWDPVSTNLILWKKI